jgi:hypothetical protein
LVHAPSQTTRIPLGKRGAPPFPSP